MMNAIDQLLSLPAYAVVRLRDEDTVHLLGGVARKP